MNSATSSRNVACSGLSLQSILSLQPETIALPRRIDRGEWSLSIRATHTTYSDPVKRHRDAAACVRAHHRGNRATGQPSSTVSLHKNLRAPLLTNCILIIIIYRPPKRCIPNIRWLTHRSASRQEYFALYHSPHLHRCSTRVGYRRCFLARSRPDKQWLFQYVWGYPCFRWPRWN